MANREGDRRSHAARIALEVVSLLATPCVLAACAIANVEQTALLSFVVVLASLGVFFASYEASAPRLRDIMPTVVLAALAAAGRILFAPIPDFKPVSAIAIIAGVAFGRKSGFMVGALAALASNFFFGQGAWTPWQMYAWGLVGYGAGLLAPVLQMHCCRKAHQNQSNQNKCAVQVNGIDNENTVDGNVGISDSNDNVVKGGTRNAGASSLAIYLYGFVSCLGYGFILNAWSIISFYHAQASGIVGVLAVYATALPFDIAHGVATVVFLLALYNPWIRKLKRIRRKFGLA